MKKVTLRIKALHSAKSVCIRSFSGPYFAKLGLNTEIYSANLRIQSKCGKIWTRKTPNTDNFCALLPTVMFCISCEGRIFKIQPRPQDALGTRLFKI